MKNIDIYTLIVASILVEAVCVVILFFTKRGGKNIKIWYANYKIGAYVFDVLSLVIGSFIPIFITNNYLLQIILVVIIGLIHDIIFGYFIVKNKPTKGISKVFFDYAKEMKTNILVVDSLMLISTIIAFNYLKVLDRHLLGFIGCLLAYIGLYIVYSFTV